jgi:predicted nuclease with RNAse H fold
MDKLTLCKHTVEHTAIDAPLSFPAESEWVHAEAIKRFSARARWVVITLNSDFRKIDQEYRSIMDSVAVF